jgi:hypothetical protein
MRGYRTRHEYEAIFRNLRADRALRGELKVNKPSWWRVVIRWLLGVQ